MNPNGTVRNLRPFSPGQSGNPGGKPVAARNKLQGDFVKALADDFENPGKAAIVTMRENDPSGYIRMIASLMPKEFEAQRPFDEFTDDELQAGIDALQRILATQGLPG